MLTATVKQVTLPPYQLVLHGHASGVFYARADLQSDICPGDTMPRTVTLAIDLPASASRLYRIHLDSAEHAAFRLAQTVLDLLVRVPAA